MDYEEITREIETKNLADSGVQKYLGKNVKSPGLVKNEHYIVKFWSIKSVEQGDNPFWLGQFLGAGEDPNQIFSVTPRAKEMVGNQRYFFRRTNSSIVAASNFNGALVVNDDNEQRITFYALLGEPRQDPLPLVAPAMRREREHPVRPAQALDRPNQRAPAFRKRERVEELSSSSMTELLESLRTSKLNAKPKREYMVAQFKTEDEASGFADDFVEGEYIYDGFTHLVRAPKDINENSNFFQKAKNKGAVQIYLHIT